MKYDLSNYRISVTGDDKSGRIFINDEFAGSYWAQFNGTYKGQGIAVNQCVKDTFNEVREWIISRFVGQFINYTPVARPSKGYINTETKPRTSKPGRKPGTKNKSKKAA